MLSESALRDPLTGLYNRTYLDAALDQLLALRRRMKSEDAAKAASDVRSRVRGLSLATSRGEAVRISVSAGCATFVEADPGAQAVIRTVEAALETARWSGKDAIVSI